MDLRLLVKNLLKIKEFTIESIINAKNGSTVFPKRVSKNEYYTFFAILTHR